MVKENKNISNKIEPLNWLNLNAPGFKELTQQEKDAVMHFSLLWSLFETQVLGTTASAEAILQKCNECAQKYALNIKDIESYLNYCKNRYIEHGQPNNHFKQLHLRKNNYPQIVARVLKGEESKAGTVLGALLIIVYRYRNNFFHGVKWADNLHDQLGNFTMANELLIKTMEIWNKAR